MKHYAGIDVSLEVRIPTGPARHSNVEPAMCTDLKPAACSDLMSATW